MSMKLAKLSRHKPCNVLVVSLLLLDMLWAVAAGTVRGVQAQAPASPLSKIKHIIFIIKENHTFDSYFGLFPNADGTTTGEITTSTGEKTIPLIDLNKEK